FTAQSPLVGGIALLVPWARGCTGRGSKSVMWLIRAPEAALGVFTMCECAADLVDQLVSRPRIHDERLGSEHSVYPATEPIFPSPVAPRVRSDQELAYTERPFVGSLVQVDDPLPQSWRSGLASSVSAISRYASPASGMTCWCVSG